MSTLFRDLRYAVRMFVKRPGFTSVVVFTLALGIGANAAVFSIVNGLLFKPLGYADPDSLVCLYSANPRLMAANPTEGWGRSNISANNFFDWRGLSTSFVDMGICRRASYNLTGGDRPELVNAVHASAGLLPVLGFDAKLGRLFREEEDQPGNERVVLLAETFWQQRFGADRGVVGQAIVLDGTPFTVLGVLPQRFEQAWGRFGGAWDQFDVWSPFAFDPSVYERDNRSFRAVGRLKPDVSVAQAQAELESIAARLAQTFPGPNRGYSVNVVPLFDAMIGREAKSVLLSLGVAVLLVLLVACVNVANLLLVRGKTRQKELAIRSALGASKWHLVRQTLAECAILSLAGGALGVLLAIWGIDALLTVIPENTPRKHEIAVDQSVLLFALLLSLVVAVAFGLVPALRGSDINLAETLKGVSRSTSTGRSTRRGRDLLVVGQVASALALVICAGLTIKSFVRLKGVDPGFDPRRLITMRVKLTDAGHANDQERAVFFERVIERIRSQPGVQSAAAVSTLPLDQLDTWSYATAEGFTAPDPERGVFLGRITVTPAYFETMRIPLLSGRDFTEQDRANRPRAVIVSEGLAERFWPGQHAIGKRLKYGGQHSGAPWLTVIGVVGNVKQRGILREARLETYLPHTQRPLPSMSFVARVLGDPSTGAAPVRNAIWEVDPDRAVFRVQSMENLIFDDIGAWGVVAGLLTVFAVIALVLAAVGLYGVMSHSVNQRRHEIGIRMALGAQARDVLCMVLRRAVGLTLLGVAGGITLALLLARLLAALMYGVSTADPGTYIALVTLLVAVALCASYLPARRATKVDPMVALRCE